MINLTKFSIYIICNLYYPLFIKYRLPSTHISLRIIKKYAIISCCQIFILDTSVKRSIKITCFFPK